MLSRLMVALVAAVLTFGSAAYAQPEGPGASAWADLNPYGEWYKLPNLGWVWQPRNLAAAWRPFSDGHWEWTDEGWLWEADEPHGWITCHYGSWWRSSEFGWFWVPGNEWSPARVEWVNTEYDVGWAPLPPPGMRLPTAFTPAGYRHWVIVPFQSFVAPQLRQHIVVRKGPTPGRPPGVLRNGPPDFFRIQKANRGPVRVWSIQKENQPAGDRQIIRFKRFEKPVGVPAHEGPAMKGPLGPAEGQVQPGRPGPGPAPLPKRVEHVQPQNTDAAPAPAPRPVAQPVPPPAAPKSVAQPAPVPPPPQPVPPALEKDRNTPPGQAKDKNSPPGQEVRDDKKDKTSPPGQAVRDNKMDKDTLPGHEQRQKEKEKAAK